MKKDTKILLQEVLRNLPNERDYSPIRYSIKKTIMEIAQLEAKQTKKRPLTPHEQWKINLETGTLTNSFATKIQQSKTPWIKDPLKLIDEMIKQEQKKIENIQKAKDPGPQTNFFG